MDKNFRGCPSYTWKIPHAKKMVQIGHFSPLECRKQSTTPYRGFPPCTIFPIQILKKYRAAMHYYLAGCSIAVCYRWWFERLLCARVLSRVVFTCDAVCVVCVCVQVQHAEDDLSDCFLVGSHHCQLAVMHTTKPRGTISHFTLPYHTLLWHIIV